MALDLITGKTQREIFFDSDACLDISKANADWLVRSLYEPVQVTLTHGDEVHVRTGSGDEEVILRLKASDVKEVKLEHKEGISAVSDVL